MVSSSSWTSRTGWPWNVGTYHWTWPNILEDLNLHWYRYENLRSLKWGLFFFCALWVQVILCVQVVLPIKLCIAPRRRGTRLAWIMSEEGSHSTGRVGCRITLTSVSQQIMLLEVTQVMIIQDVDVSNTDIARWIWVMNEGVTKAVIVGEVLLSKTVKTYHINCLPTEIKTGDLPYTN